ncbi:MAG: M48 family metallopeptidase [Vallitaleaceae bacterium]|nr:M48 family metallopeptidase [Vallitaleaceae bacterium]
MEQYTLKIGTKTIPIEVQRKKVKNINIRVKSGGTVYVSAPKQVTGVHIQEILQKRAQWIHQSLHHFEQQVPVLPQGTKWEDGDVVPFLGESYLLNIDSKCDQTVKLDETSKRIVMKPSEDPAQSKRRYEDWLRQQGVILFEQIMTEQIAVFKLPLKKSPILKIRKMKARWGTCFSTRNTIQLNLELMKNPMPAIEYVILHELAHFLHPNHSKAFYDYVAMHMPDWKVRKAMLKKINQ